jgi:hypothetical protein
MKQDRAPIVFLHQPEPRGKPLVIVNLISTTTIQTGLNLPAKLNANFTRREPRRQKKQIAYKLS